MRFFREVFRPPYEFKEIIRQCYEIGWKSLPLISLTGFITGIVFTNQSRPSLAEFGATSWLPALISIAIIRALRSEVRRVGKAWVSKCRSRWSPDSEKKNDQKTNDKSD